MNINERSNLIHLMVMELDHTVKSYEEARKKHDYPMPGYDITNFESRTALKRRITVIREELLELSKQLDN